MSETGNEINGDLSVSRGITAGGDIATKGSLEVEHDVHVKGWLIAKALKGAMRGLYVSEKSLMEVTALRLEVKSLLKDDGDGDLEQKIKDLEFEMRRYEEDRDIMSSDIADLKVDVGILKAPAG